jgi:cobalt-zinc-cadmium efflux system membrane fusion protein
LLLGLLLSAVALETACGRQGDTAPLADRARAATTTAAGIIVVPPDSPQLKQLRVAPVGVADLPSDEVTAPGRLIIDPNRVSRVLLPVSGRIVSVLAALGAVVEAGQPVVTVDSPDADSAVATYLQAQAAERQATATLAKAEEDLRRATELHERGAVATKDLLGARNDLAQAQGVAEAARAAREQGRRRLELLGLKPGEFKQQILVRAPIDGKVLDVNVAPGEYRTDTTAPLMTIAQLDRVWFAAEVPEASIRLVRVGESVRIALVAFPGEVIAGRVTRIADVLDPQTRTVKVYAELANPGGRLRPDMFGSLRATGSELRQTILPLSAVVEEYGKRTVFRERGPGQFERREVTLGPPAGDVAPVRQGVAPGDRVVVDGAMLLKDR